MRQSIFSSTTNLFHYTGLAFGECDMPSALVLDKFNLDLSTTGFLLGTYD